MSPAAAPGPIPATHEVTGPAKTPQSNNCYSKIKIKYEINSPWKDLGGEGASRSFPQLLFPSPGFPCHSRNAATLIKHELGNHSSPCSPRTRGSGRGDLFQRGKRAAPAQNPSAAALPPSALPRFYFLSFFLFFFFCLVLFFIFFVLLFFFLLLPPPIL